MRISDWSSDVCSSDLENQNSFGPVHKISRLGDIGARRARLEHLASIASDDQAAGTTSDFGDLIDTETFDDSIERRRDRRQCTELLDHALARGERRTTENRSTVLITHRFRPGIAILVRKYGHQPNREAFGEEIGRANV